MSEQRPTYGPPLTWHTVVSYYLHHYGQTSEHTGNTLEVEARDAIQAGEKALEAVRKMTPKASTVFDLVLTVSLIVPDRNGGNEQ